MHDFKRRTGWASLRVKISRLAAFCLLILLLSGLMPAAASGMESEEAAVRAAAESILRNYEEMAMLYEARDLRSGTVAEPGLVLPEEVEAQIFPLGKKEVTLAQMRENVIYLEKKAGFYIAMRQMQDIYRENLRLYYTMESLTLEENIARAYIRETAQFRYTDSDRQSVYEVFFTVYLVKLEDRWLVADVTDGSRFDSLYKSQGAAFDENAALAEFAAQLAREGCTVSFPYTPYSSADRIPYNGANAAAYAYTYSRQTAGTPRSEFYNAQFVSYAGAGGDCMNFASQCMWAGFGGDQTDSAIGGKALPMDTVGENQWFGCAAYSKKFSHGWISCQSFRQYLTGNREGTGRSGSNDAADTGMYATILDVAAGSGFYGVTAEELLGAAAHVEGSGGAYSHAIVFTAVTGTKRSEVWFCGHTKDITHVKLGDYYFGPMKVYIPRYLRAAGAADNMIQMERCQPVEAGGAGLLSARLNAVQQQVVITVTSPEGVTRQAISADNTDNCWTEYVFLSPGLYRVTCRAMAYENAPLVTASYYVRCYAPEDVASGDEGGAEDSEISEMPAWLRQPAEG